MLEVKPFHCQGFVLLNNAYTKNHTNLTDCTTFTLNRILLLGSVGPEFPALCSQTQS